jgi:hypothetical protein
MVHQQKEKKFRKYFLVEGKREIQRKWMIRITPLLPTLN